MTITGRDQFIRECLDDVAARIRMRRKKKPFDVANVRRTLLDVIRKDKGFSSFRLAQGDEEVMIDFFDRRPDFERVSDQPEWKMRAVRRPPPEPARQSL